MSLDILQPSYGHERESRLNISVIYPVAGKRRFKFYAIVCNRCALVFGRMTDRPKCSGTVAQGFFTTNAVPSKLPVYGVCAYSKDNHCPFGLSPVGNPTNCDALGTDCQQQGALRSACVVLPSFRALPVYSTADHITPPTRYVTNPVWYNLSKPVRWV